MRLLKSLIYYSFLILCWNCSQKILPGNTTLNNSIEISILCYNIHHANPPSRNGIIDLEAIAKVITENSPDLVALQEVDVYTNRSGKTSNQAKDLAFLSRMPYYYFAKAIDYDGGEYGVAILSKYPITDMKNQPLPTAENTGGEKRTLATAVINLKNGQKIVFACTHLDAQRNDTNRLLQINKIIEILKREAFPVILAGDLNAVAGTPVIDTLDSYFTRTCVKDCGFTIPVQNPIKTIDFIAYMPSNKFKVLEHKVIDEKYASDHLPVLATLRIER